MNRIKLDPSKIRDLSAEVLDDAGRMRVLPAAYWVTTTVEQRALFGHVNGIHTFPTTELVEHLTQVIAGRPAIEIGAGNGVLADALGIPGTDNRQYDIAKYALLLAMAGQPPVRYGPNIVHLDAARAVRTYKPEVVVGCWITHRYEVSRHYAGGNEIGVDERDVLAHCRTYVLIGNEKVHRHSRLWDLPHTVEYPSWLYSRAHSGGRDFIATWTG